MAETQASDKVPETTWPAVVWAARLSVYLLALWVLTYFGRPFE